MHRLLSVLSGNFVVVYSLFVVTLDVWGFCVGPLFCVMVLGALSSLAIISLRKKKLVLLL